MQKIAATIIVLLGSCLIAEKGSIWFGNTFIYTQDMRDSEAAAAAYNREMLQISGRTQKITYGER
jgi:predicted metal-dependent HD superfamily phosphohydrolase